MITSLEIMIFEPRTTPATIIHIQIRHHDLLKKKKKKKNTIIHAVTQIKKCLK